jgi:hypothetical protein
VIFSHQKENKGREERERTAVKAVTQFGTKMTSQENNEQLERKKSIMKGIWELRLLHLLFFFAFFLSPLSNTRTTRWVSLGAKRLLFVFLFFRFSILLL